MSVALQPPEPRLAFSATAFWQAEWLQYGDLLAFRCELTPIDQRSHPDLRAFLLARLTVKHSRVFDFKTSLYEFDRVEDLDFAVVLDGKTVYEAYGVTAMLEEKALVFTQGIGAGYTRIGSIRGGFIKAVQRERA